MLIKWRYIFNIWKTNPPSGANELCKFTQVCLCVPRQYSERWQTDGEDVYADSDCSVLQEVPAAPMLLRDEVVIILRSFVTSVRLHIGVPGFDIVRA